MRDDYNVTILAADQEYKGRAAIAIKSTDLSVNLGNYLKSNGKLLVDIEHWVIMQVHNEHAKKDKDYKVIKLIDRNGESYISGSESLISSFTDIWDELEDEFTDNIADGCPEKNYVELELYMKQSKNDSTNSFITCRLV